MTTDSEPADCKVVAIFRDGGGEMHLDWPVERIPEAIQDAKGILWVDVEDAPDQPSRRAEELLRDVFGFHALAVDDALRESHVPRIDDWEDYLYIVFHAYRIDPTSGDLALQEVDVFLGVNYLVTYHQAPLDFLSEGREAIKEDPRERMRDGADHLLFRFLDRSIDQSLEAIDDLDERIDRVQNAVMSGRARHGLTSIFGIKRAAIKLHRTFGPQRDVLNRLARDPFKVVHEKNRVYFRDVYDHIVRIHDVSEGLRDLIAGTLDTYLSVVSNRTNEIMKALTMVTVMFMPMSFLTGFFGMNFFGPTLAFESSLPKQALFWGTLALMALSPVAMLVLARRRGWF